MFITPALAQGTTGTGGTSFLIQLMPFILIFAIMYFLIIRPQQRRMKQHREMVAGVQRGDTVVTAGGLIGRVTKVVNDEELQVEVADGVRVRVVRSTLSDVRSRSEAKAAPKPAKTQEAEAGQEAVAESDAAPPLETPESKASADGAKSASVASQVKSRSSRGRAATASRSGSKKSGRSKSRTSRSREAADRPPGGEAGQADGPRE